MKNQNTASYSRHYHPRLASLVSWAAFFFIIPIILLFSCLLQKYRKDFVSHEIAGRKLLFWMKVGWKLYCALSLFFLPRRLRKVLLNLDIIPVKNKKIRCASMPFKLLSRKRCHGETCFLFNAFWEQSWQCNYYLKLKTLFKLSVYI